MGMYKDQAISVTERVKQQTNDEWMWGYDNPITRRTEPYSEPMPVKEALSKKQAPEFEYAGYSTTRDKHGKGRVILRFVDLESGEEIPAFFYAEITHQRGELKGKDFETGKNGQFWITKNHKLAKFWLNTFKTPPNRWSALYRVINRFNKFTFTGDIKSHPEYVSLDNVRRLI